MQQCLLEGRFKTEQQRGVISLFPKKGNNDRFIRNWRPITLLNTDYKIVIKAIAQRLQYCIKSIIHTGQTGFMRGRYIGSNIKTIQDIINYTQADEYTHPHWIPSYSRWTMKSVRLNSMVCYSKSARILWLRSLLPGNNRHDLVRSYFGYVYSGYTSAYFKPKNGARLLRLPVAVHNHG